MVVTLRSEPAEIFVRASDVVVAFVKMAEVAEKEVVVAFVRSAFVAASAVEVPLEKENLLPVTRPVLSTVKSVVVAQSRVEDDITNTVPEFGVEVGPVKMESGA